MFMVYQQIYGNVIPTGIMKPYKDFEVGEIFMCPEYGVEGLSYIPYVITGKTIMGKGLLITSERLGV